MRRERVNNVYVGGFVNRIRECVRARRSVAMRLAESRMRANFNSLGEVFDGSIYVALIVFLSSAFEIVDCRIGCLNLSKGRTRQQNEHAEKTDLSKHW